MRDPLDVGARIGDLDSAVLAARQWKRVRESRLDRAAPAQGTATVVDAREEPLLESVGDVRVATEA
jgi:hypothetical protein